MKKDLIIKKCLKCGALVKVINDCDCEDCGLMCCNEQMKVITPNSVEAAIEKHIPTYEIDKDTIKVKVNHVMDPDHFIEWICLKTEEKEEYVYLEPNKDAVATFSYNGTGILYAYCNKHGLWKVEVK